MALPIQYKGQGFSLRGEKSRFVLPPSFRKDFADKGDERILCLGKHERWPCLKAFSQSAIAGFEDILDREEEAALRRDKDYDRELRGAQLLSYVEVPFDASGRFVMPDHLTDLAGLGDEIFFQGGMPFFTIWAPEKLYSMGEAWENGKANCRTLAETAKKKAKAK
ncbi:division/cell wall cluster transcriptional repressor MraZ [Aurantiacibacter suaedae]|uniref:division/cell wall cluster transcriptional repressor MraZ n=1 Tax=Aurantiacibacter suaedae TaxID=2545755 RepID=UPI001F501233|nr:division/cell wall cluster transcriptional repressor MraZ [Aurantiacibacter suaedae]